MAEQNDIEKEIATQPNNQDLMKERREIEDQILKCEIDLCKTSIRGCHKLLLCVTVKLVQKKWESITPIVSRFDMHATLNVSQVVACFSGGMF